MPRQNLDLNAAFRSGILDWIEVHRPELYELARDVFENKGETLNTIVRAMMVIAYTAGLDEDDAKRRPTDEKLSVDAVTIGNCLDCPWYRHHHERKEECCAPGGERVGNHDVVGPPPGWCPLRTRPKLVEMGAQKLKPEQRAGG